MTSIKRSATAFITENGSIHGGAGKDRGLPPEVLVLDAENRQALACLRIYGRAGIRVGAVACSQHAAWAPGLRSRWSSVNASVPDFAIDADAYVDGLLAVLDQYPARLLIPSHDGSMEALRRRRRELEQRTSLALASEAALEIAVSKERTLALARTLGIATPRSVPLDDLRDVPAAVAEVGLPAMLKPVQSWVEGHGSASRFCCEVIRTADEARRRLQPLLSAGGRGLLQEWIPGRREAISLFFAEGRFWARFAQMSHREWPVSGGVSVLCEGITPPVDCMSAAEELVRQIGLEGCSMVEFRRDAANRPVLMEINPRMGSSVELAVASGVNLPQLLLDWKLGEPLTEMTSYRTGRRLRWLAGDIWNLKCTLDSEGEPDARPRTASLLRFVFDSIRPGNTLDVFDWGDMRPALSEMNEMVLRHVWRRVRRCVPSLPLSSVREVS